MERPLTKNLRSDAPDLAETERVGGYQAARKALREMRPADVIDLVKRSGLRGRGGAGFPTGAKWSFVPMGSDVPHPKYLIANADEMEPGSFKDRLLLEGDPHQLIEGMIVSAYAIEANVGYIFLRWEYRVAAQRLALALRQAYERGYLGRYIMGSGFSFDLHLHVSAGRYMCGEETGLLNSLEGKRAVPRSKPPFPQSSGLWGKPTVVQNVETLCNVPHIVNHGADWFRTLSLSEEGGTKIFGVSGKVRRPGAWELPLGTPCRRILEEHAGGMKDGVRLRAVLPGGASTAFLAEDQLDVKMDFDSVARAGSRLGTGTMIALDDRTCPVGMLANLERFFARESCGWCTPCREGLPWVQRILDSMEEGRGQPGDIETLQRHGRFLGMGLTFCALAPGAVEPLRSALTLFRDDFERHLREKRCPWR
ncbi:MAG: NADH-quinone oxidoreductase subunit NuoF [Planctomycetes bacterium]|nr:NADH-quinone oxidoreductase subunit NuoF [Planctomycetota bacterium]